MSATSAASERRVVVLAGPTAVGKSALGLELAERLGAEIVNADATAVYRGMDIGTDKPAAADRRRVPHHLIDVCDPRETFTAADYQTLARRAIADISARGRLPLLVGGSGLYIRGAVRQLALPPAPPDPGLRAELGALSSGELHARLARVDPPAAARIDRANRRRMIRAIEIFLVAGQPASALWTADRAASPYDLLYVVIDRPRDELYARIEARVRRELGDGLADEVRRLLAAGVSPAAPSMQALGYKEVVPYVRGEIDRETLVETLARHTRRFAKRQLTWFRAEPGAWWLDLASLGERGALQAVLRRLGAA